jgi:ribosomal protein S26
MHERAGLEHAAYVRLIQAQRWIVPKKKNITRVDILQRVKLRALTSLSKVPPLDRHKFDVYQCYFASRSPGFESGG